MLRILIAHNSYQYRGGEDAVVEAEAELLRKHGHTVDLYSRHNDELESGPSLRTAADAVWSARTRREVSARIAAFGPDVVHVHNILPLISPSIYYAASQAGVPVVQTVHNFRLVCPQGLMLRNERPCEDCVGRTPWRGVVHRCYRGSLAQTAVVAAMLTVHRQLGTWDRRVTRYIALTAFARDRLIAGGLPAARICVKPNFIDLPQSPRSGPRAGFLYVGRLSHEKGIDVLAQAMQTGIAPEPVTVVGTGPDAERLSGIRSMTLAGALPSDEVYLHMQRACALVLPSICYDNFPRTLVEAFANSLPVIASRLGPLATLVEHGRTGLLFEPGDPRALAEALEWASAHPRDMAAMGSAARETYERELSAEVNHRQLLAIYEEAIQALGNPLSGQARAVQ